MNSKSFVVAALMTLCCVSGSNAVDNSDIAEDIRKIHKHFQENGFRHQPAGLPPLNGRRQDWVVVDRMNEIIKHCITYNYWILNRPGGLNVFGMSHTDLSRSSIVSYLMSIDSYVMDAREKAWNPNARNILQTLHEHIMLRAHAAPLRSKDGHLLTIYHEILDLAQKAKEAERGY